MLTKLYWSVLFLLDTAMQTRHIPGERYIVLFTNDATWDCIIFDNPVSALEAQKAFKNMDKGSFAFKLNSIIDLPGFPKLTNEVEQMVKELNDCFLGDFEVGQDVRAVVSKRVDIKEWCHKHHKRWLKNNLGKTVEGKIEAMDGSNYFCPNDGINILLNDEDLDNLEPIGVVIPIKE